jgi:hypothetical protein
VSPGGGAQVQFAAPLSLIQPQPILFLSILSSTKEEGMNVIQG